MPTRLAPNFVVRDFGSGIPENVIYSVYAQYWNSTKDKTNDQTGCLGLGSKSGFAKGDVFTITSIVNAETIRAALPAATAKRQEAHELLNTQERLSSITETHLISPEQVAFFEQVEADMKSALQLIEGTGRNYRSVYQAIIDITEIGKMNKMFEEVTDLPTGIEVAIPSTNDEIHSFNHKATEFFRWWSLDGTPRPNFINGEETVAALDGFDALASKYSGTVCGDSPWKLMEDGIGQSVVVMGRIAYPLPGHIFNYQTDKMSYDLVQSGRLVIQVPLGTAVNATSREALQFDVFIIRAHKQRICGQINKMERAENGSKMRVEFSLNRYSLAVSVT